MRTPRNSRPASAFRYSPLIAALACVLAPQDLASPAVTYGVPPPAADVPNIPLTLPPASD